MRWGERLEFMAETGPGDFIYVPPFVPHQEINASSSEPLECVVVRSDNEAVVVNLDIEPAEKPRGLMDRSDQRLRSAASSSSQVPATGTPSESASTFRDPDRTAAFCCTSPGMPDSARDSAEPARARP